MDKINITINVNGEQKSAHVSPDLPLIEFLQDDMGLTGTKFCCGIGVCRACCVAVRPVADAPAIPTLSCSTPVSAVNNQYITTVEGLGNATQLSPLQEAFLTHFAFQCGYCTPGFLMAATILIEQLQQAPIKKEEIDDAIAEACGEHICRCTGYVRYYQAIRDVIIATPGALK